VSSHSEKGHSERVGDTKKEKEATSSVYAGDINVGKDTLTSRKEEAQKKAMKLMSDVLAGDSAIDDTIDKGIQDMKDYETASAEAYQGLAKTNELRAQLDESDPDYESLSAEYNEMEKIYTKQMSDSKDAINSIQRSIIGIELDRLKTHPMVDAAEGASSILEAASAETVSSLMTEAIDQVDQEMEDNIKNAEEKAAKKKEQEDAIEAAKREDTEVGTSQQDQASSEPIEGSSVAPVDIQKELQNILDKLKLMSDDLKGAAVDTKL